MSGPSDVKDFYDKFSQDVLLKDFRRVNLRQLEIKKLCDRYVPSGSRVLEIGCGVGIISKHLQAFASRIVGIDISERNVEIARAYAGADNTEFRVLDIVEQASVLESYGAFDVILLPDVIEHIPKERYRDLFETIERHIERPGWVLLTFPSPEYQEYLKAKNPDTLQVVDESVDLREILQYTSLDLLYFSYKDVSHKNQYVHVVLTSDRSFRPDVIARTMLENVTYRMRKYRWILANRSFVRRITSRLARKNRSNG